MRKWILFFLLIFLFEHSWAQIYEDTCIVPKNEIAVVFYKNEKRLKLDNKYELYFRDTLKNIIRMQLLSDSGQEEIFSKLNLKGIKEVCFNFKEYKLKFKGIRFFPCTDSMEFGVVDKIQFLKRKYSEEELRSRDSSFYLTDSFIYLYPGLEGEFFLPNVDLKKVKSIFYVRINTGTNVYSMRYWICNYYK